MVLVEMAKDSDTTCVKAVYRGMRNSFWDLNGFQYYISECKSFFNNLVYISGS